MNRAFAFTSLLLLVCVPDLFAAGELYQFAMYHSDTMAKEECALVSRYSREKEELTRFPGQLSANGCEVSFPHQLYEDRFQFCFLSGFNLYKISNPEMIECVIQKRDDSYMFLAGIEGTGKNDAQVMCYFTCIGVKGK